MIILIKLWGKTIVFQTGLNISPNYASLKVHDLFGHRKHFVYPISKASNSLQKRFKLINHLI